MTYIYRYEIEQAARQISFDPAMSIPNAFGRWLAPSICEFLQATGCSDSYFDPSDGWRHSWTHGPKSQRERLVFLAFMLAWHDDLKGRKS